MESTPRTGDKVNWTTLRNGRSGPVSPFWTYSRLGKSYFRKHSPWGMIGRGCDRTTAAYFQKKLKIGGLVTSKRLAKQNFFIKIPRIPAKSLIIFGFSQIKPSPPAYNEL